MIALRAMTEESFAGYLESQIANYAVVKVNAGAWPAEGAEERARHDFGKFLPAGLASPGQSLFDLVSQPAGDVVGKLWLELESQRDPGVAFIYHVAVDPDFQGRGFGAEAMALAEERARRHGCREMRLQVFGDNTVARALYSKAGYTIVDILMRKPL
jgi:ribosomal protein S18 acetylase RimI-like enzyme